MSCDREDARREGRLTVAGAGVGEDRLGLRRGLRRPACTGSRKAVRRARCARVGGVRAWWAWWPCARAGGSACDGHGGGRDRGEEKRSHRALSFLWSLSREVSRLREKRPTARTKVTRPDEQKCSASEEERRPGRGCLTSRRRYRCRRSLQRCRRRRSRRERRAL